MMLKKLYLPLILSLLLICIVPQFAFAWKNNFRVYNFSGKTIYRIHMKFSSSSDWGANLIEGKMMKSGESCPGSFEGERGEPCDITVRLELDDGSYTWWTWYNLDFSNQTIFAISNDGNIVSK